MKNKPNNTIGAINGDNHPNSHPAAQAGETPPAFFIIKIEGVDYISDGKYQLPVKKGRYSLKPVQNPSGKLVVQLSGYRPNASLASQISADAGEDIDASNADDGSSKGKVRFRKNYRRLKVADAKRSELIREDSNSSTCIHEVSTFLSEEEVRDAEAATGLMADLPAPARPLMDGVSRNALFGKSKLSSARFGWQK